MPEPLRVNEVDLEPEEQAPETDGFERKRLSRAVGGEKLGCSLYVLAPGRKSWPYHYHTGNEEAMYVLEGTGTLRLAGERIEIRPGDYVALPTGEGGAHRVENTSEADLRYLCFSTMIEPEVSVYPDSNAVGVFAGAPPGGDPDERVLKRFLDADADVAYWQDETE